METPAPKSNEQLQAENEELRTKLCEAVGLFLVEHDHRIALEEAIRELTREFVARTDSDPTASVQSH